MEKSKPADNVESSSVVSMFVTESLDLLKNMETSLLILETQPDSQEALADVFRAAHTIKGNAGIFGFDEIVTFTHIVESVLDEVRKGEVEIDVELIALLLTCCDHIVEKLKRTTQATSEDSPDQAETAAKLISKLQENLPAKRDDSQASLTETTPSKITPDDSHSRRPISKSENWQISIRMGRDALRDGMDPLSVLSYLGTLGKIVHIVASTDGMPPLSEMDPESCYLELEIEFNSDARKEQIEEAFQFIRANSKIGIRAPLSKVSEFLHTVDILPEDRRRIGEILVASGALTALELEDSLRMQQQTTPAVGSTRAKKAAQSMPSRPLGEILVENGAVLREVVVAALRRQRQLREGVGAETHYVRVRADKLDRLINRVGELVIAGAGANQLARRVQDVTLQEASTVVTRLVEEIREDALALRMVQIGDSFNRFRRVVRDMSPPLGKDIALVIHGAQTELDKTIVEKIADPLMHLVRNAIDHGIETAEVRRANGKPSQGTLTLNAYHESGSIVIDVSDDGKGLNKEKILKKAIERGALTSDQKLEDSEIFNFIFEPGFSTADSVTSISGRGVGMDVVRRNILDLRGTVELATKEGVGTTVRIRLPLTLAIIDGFVVGVAKSAYVFPLAAVIECVELNGEEYPNGSERGFVNLRGNVLPYLHLRKYFRLGGESGRRENIVVVQHGGQHAGFVVDELLGEFQTVIKPLSRLFGSLRGISGSTILGGGDVALIVDVPELIKSAVGGRSRLDGRDSPGAHVLNHVEPRRVS